MKSVNEFLQFKSMNKKISMVTCYDYTMAKITDTSPVDTVLVGDSVAMVVHGHPTTINADLPMLSLHTQAVRRGTGKFLISDMPFLTFRKGILSAMRACEKLMRAGANAVKLEGVTGHEKVIAHIVHSGIPVMGHLGFTPQSLNQLGGFKVQGVQEPDKLLKEAKKLEDLGVFSIVLECIPGNLAGEITSALRIPTIGIGAGPHVDGQVLVFHDLLGLDRDFNPVFLKKYFNGYGAVSEALTRYDDEVKKGQFPSDKESYHGRDYKKPQTVAEA